MKRAYSSLYKIVLFIFILGISMLVFWRHDAVVNAADTTVTTYEELVSAINNASDGDVIIINGTITVEDTITIKNKRITIKGSGNLVGGQLRL